MSIRADSIVLLTQSVGRRVYVTARLLSDVRHEQTVDVHTTLVVREDSMTLFGFAAESERDLFDVLLSVSGIGPKLALAALSVLTPEELHRAIASEDLAALCRIPGVGKKSAQRLVLELGSKLGPAPTARVGAAQAMTLTTANAQVVDALVGLGWQSATAEDAVAAVAKATPDASVPDLLRAALKSLGRS